MKEKYFIHLLDTPVGKYIYDVNTNNIIETMNKVLAILNQGNKYFEKCKDCWIFSLCGVCALNSDMVNNGYCELQKKDIERRMINYIILRKFGLEFV